MTIPETNDAGEVFLEGQLIGAIKGLRFNLASSGADTHTKELRSAVIAPQIHNRAQRLIIAPNDQIVLSSDGFVRWKGEIIAELAAGETLFAPRVLVLSDESLAGAEMDNVQERLQLWLAHTINTRLEQILALREPAELTGTARGIAFRLAENFGILARHRVAQEVKGLDQEVRGKMRRLGVRFGAYHIYLPQSLKPAPRELALILYALHHGGLRQPGVSDIPAIVLSGRTSFETDPEVNPALYEAAGFKLAGKRAVRVDILERLADIIRPQISFDAARTQGEAPEGAAERNGFRVTVQMTSLLGCAGEDFSLILKSLGYRVQRQQIEKPVLSSQPEAAPPDNDPASIKDVGEAATLDGVEPAQAGILPPTGQPDEETLVLARLDGADAGEVAKQSQAENPPRSPIEETADAPTPQAVDTPDKEPVSKQPPEQPQNETAPDETTKETDEPLFDEVWFPGSRRSSAPKQHRPGRPNPAADPAGHKPAHKARPKGDKPNNPNSSRHAGAKYSARPGREKPIDPDSPFAALAVLKQKLPKK